MRDELSEILGVKKDLLDQHDDITIAKLYCLKYVADPNSYSFVLNRINKKDLTVTVGSQKLNINEYLDTQIYNDNYLAKENITRRFNDPNREDYLDNASNTSLDSALQTIRNTQQHIAEKIQTTLIYINDLKKNKILDEILKYNHLDYSGNLGDIDGKIIRMKEANNVSVEKEYYNALLVLGLDLSEWLKEKFTMVRSRTQSPTKVGADPTILAAPRQGSMLGSGSVAGAGGAAEEAQIKSDSIEAIKRIAACIGVQIEGNEGGLLEKFVGKILEGERYVIKDGSQEDYDEALGVLLNDENYQWVVDLLGQYVHSEAAAAFEATGPVTSSRAPVFGEKPASPSPEPKSPSTDEIKGKIEAYKNALSEESGMGGENFRGELSRFLNEAKINIDQDPQLFERLNLFFQSVDKIGGVVVLVSATQSKNINSEHVLEKGVEKVNLSVDCIESRLMRTVEADTKSFNYVIGARNINLQTQVEGNFVLVDFDNKPDNESYAPYAVPDDDNFLRDDTQKNLYKLNLLDGISKMANAITGGATDIRVTCVEGKGRSVTLALLFAKICNGDFSLNETRDKDLIEKLARDRNSDYNYVTTGSDKCNDYQNSAKFQMLTEVLGEFQERLKTRDADSMFFEKVKQAADSIRRAIVIERKIENKYRNQLSPVGIGV